MPTPNALPHGEEQRGKIITYSRITCADCGDREEIPMGPNMAWDHFLYCGWTPRDLWRCPDCSLPAREGEGANTP